MGVCVAYSAAIGNAKASSGGISDKVIFPRISSIIYNNVVTGKDGITIDSMNARLSFQKIFPNKWYDLFYLIIYLALFAISLLSLYNNISTGKGQFITDNLYNFGGGFIRRGLGGELAFFIQDYFKIPMRWSLYLTSLSAYIFLSAVTVRYFIKRGYGLNVLIMSFALGGVLIFGFDAFRRDYIELSLFAIALICYRKMSLMWWPLIGNLTIMFGIALHEATFFFTIPILILITNCRKNNLLKSTAVWTPSIMMFIICCICKGSTEALPNVVERAMAYAPQCFQDGKIPRLLEFMEKDTWEVFKFHLDLNYQRIAYFGSIPIPAFVLTLFYFIYIPYMTVAMLMKFTSKTIPSDSIINLVKLIFIQFICLLPMFTVLSCDIARVSCYWIMSSLLVWVITSNEEQTKIFKRYHVRFGNTIYRALNSKWLPGKLTLTALMFCIGIVFYLRIPTDVIICSLGYHFLYVLKLIFLKTIHVLSLWI